MSMQKNPEKKPKINSFFLAIVFLVLGIYLFIVAVLLGSQIICLVGLGLTFWGALFLLAPPSKHVEANFLITSSLPDYMTIDRMLTYINSKNEAYNTTLPKRHRFTSTFGGAQGYGYLHSSRGL
jgi:hypothetical protein